MTIDRYGDPNNPCIILLHGAALNRKMWLPVAHRLSRHFYILAPDLPGHGAQRDQPFAFDVATRGIEQVVNSEGLKDYVLAGDSLGGYAAIDYASHYPTGPEGLFICGASRDIVGGIGALVRFSIALQEIIIALIGHKRINGLVEKTLLKMAPLETHEPLIAAGLNGQARTDAMKALIGVKFSQMLADYEGAVLFANADRDRINRKGEARFLAQARQARTALIKNSSHGASLQQPEAFADALDRFAESVFQRGAFPDEAKPRRL